MLLAPQEASFISTHHGPRCSASSSVAQERPTSPSSTSMLGLCLWFPSPLVLLRATKGHFDRVQAALNNDIRLIADRFLVELLL